jgi:hypothetical protein
MFNKAFPEVALEDSYPAYGLLFLESILKWLEMLVKMGFVRRLHSTLVQDMRIR